MKQTQESRPDDGQKQKQAIAAALSRLKPAPKPGPAKKAKQAVERLTTEVRAAAVRSTGGTTTGMRFNASDQPGPVDDRRRQPGQDNYDPKTGRWSKD